VSTTPFGWRDFLVLANQLLDDAGGKVPEARLRTATSRAYYAAYCECKSYAVLNLGYVPSNDVDDHFNVRKAFRDHGREGDARDLRQLRDWRDRCDYEPQVPGICAMTVNAIEKAKMLLARLESG